MNKLIVVMFTAIITIALDTHASEDEKIYTVGIVPQFEARKTHLIWRPILDLLEIKTGYKFKLRGSTSIPAFEREFMEGKFDFSYMNPYHFVVANEKAGYIPLVRDNGRKLHGVLVVNKESNITSPSQLSGKTVAFPAPNALGASLLMQKELRDNFGIKFKPVFVKTHDSVYLNVLLNQTSAGGGVQKTLDRQPDNYKKQLRVIHKTQEVTPHPFAALPDIPTEVRERIRDAMLDLGQSENGQKLLSEIPIKSIGPASLNDYQPLKSMDLHRFYVRPNQ